MHLNLLPASTRLLIQFDHQLRGFLKLWMVLGLMVVIYLTYQLFLCRSAMEQLTQLDAACDPIRKLQKDIQRQHQTLAAWQRRRTTLISLQPATQPVAILGSVVQAIAAQPGKVRLQRISIQQEANSPQAPGGAHTPAPAAASQLQTIVLMGEAEDDSALSQLVQDMQRMGAMDKVELKSSSRTPNLQTRQFHIEACVGMSRQPLTRQAPQNP